jgi:hypothetical protein
LQPQATARKRGDRTGPNYDENGDYLVGKNRPPVEHRFQKDGTGNKKGPKTGEVDFIKEINKELAKKLPIKLGGKRVSKDVVQLIAHNLRAMIIEKNLGAMKIAAQWRLMGEAQGNSGASPSVSAEQLDVINQLLNEAGYDANPVVRKAPGEPS